MQIALSIPGRPLSTQTLYKRSIQGRMYMTEEGHSRKATYQIMFKMIALKMKWEKDGEFEVKTNLYFGDKRKHDIDNYSKILLDAATGFIWDDDNQIKKMTVEKHYDKNKPRVDILVTRNG